MKTLSFTLFFLHFFYLMQAQVYVTGTVRDASSKEPIADAAIRLVGSGQVVKTNKTGDFRLPVSGEMAQIEITNIAYETMLTTVSTNDPPIEILLRKRIILIDEVEISTGYQSLPKERLTGSFNHIDNETFNRQVGTDVLSRLEAVANGLTVDRATASSQLTIRGLSTLSGDRTPLIVLDDFPYDGDINNINPNDVENITILKDAAAASIWGARAGNGVIVITTKKGAFEQPTRIDFNSNLSVGDKPNLGYMKQMSSTDYIALEEYLYNEGNYISQVNSTTRTALTPVVELLIRKEREYLPEAEVAAELQRLKQHDVRNDFLKHMYTNSLNQQYNLSISGGTAAHSWLLSSGIDRNRNNLDAWYNRINLRAQHSSKLGDRVNMNIMMNYTQSKHTNGRPGYTDVTFRGGTIYPYAELADGEGNALPVVASFRQHYVDTVGNGKLLDWSYYPLNDHNNYEMSSSISDMVINTDLSYRIIDGITAGIRYRYEQQRTLGNSHYGKDSYFARDLINQFTQLPEGAIQPIYIVPLGGILDQSNDLLNSHQGRAQVNVDKQWSQHRLNGLIGFEARHSAKRGSQFRNYGYDENTGGLVHVDYTRTYPRIYNGIGAFIPSNHAYSGGTIRFVSMFTNLGYSYKDRYLISISGRRDASNLYGVNIRDKWQPLWSAGLGWVLSAEDFYRMTFLPFLKIRATYGYSGNTDPSRVALTTIQTISASPYTNLPMVRFSQYANPDLKWETSAQINIGIDFRTKGSRINGSVEYYQKRSYDLLAIDGIDYTNGIGLTVIKNAAEIEGKGVDLMLKTINTNGAFRWDTDFNFSIYGDRIIDYFLANKEARSFFTSGNPRVSGLKEKAVYPLFSYKWAGLDAETGLARGIGQDGLPSTDYRTLTGNDVQVEDLNYHGPAMPRYFGNIANTFSFRDFSLSLSIMFKMGHYFRRETIDYESLFSSGRGHSDYSRRWQRPGDEQYTAIPAMVYPAPQNLNNFYAYSEPFIERADHIRFQYLHLAYNLPAGLTKKIRATRVQFYANAANLGIIWRANNENIDPEYRGAYSLPPAKTVSLGLRVNF